MQIPADAVPHQGFNHGKTVVLGVLLYGRPDDGNPLAGLNGPDSQFQALLFWYSMKAFMELTNNPDSPEGRRRISTS